MDQITNLYKNRAEALLEQVNFLEKKLQYLTENPGQYQGNFPNEKRENPKYGRGTRSGLIGGGGTVQGSEEIDFTGGNIDPSTGAWSPSSGGAAIADSEAGDNEIKERMRKIARGGGLFDKGVDKTEQTPAYKEMAGELERRRQAREAAKSGVKTVASTGDKGGTQKVPGTEAPSGRVAKQPMQIPDSGKIAVTPPTGPAGTGGPGDTSRAPARPQPMAQPTVATGKKQDDGGIDPKLILLGLAGAAYGGKKVYDYYGRQREKGKAPTTQEPGKPSVKPQEPTKPSVKPGEKVSVPAEMQQGTYKVGKTPDAFQASMVQNPPEWEMKGRAQFGIDMPSGKQAANTPMTSTIPEKGQANRSALDRDLQRAKDALDTNKPMNFEKPNAQVKTNVPETQVKPGDISTKGGQVVSKGSSVSSKAANLLAKAGKGLLHFGVQTGGAIAGEAAAEDAARAMGVGKTESRVLSTLGVGVPMSVVPALAGTPAAIAVGGGYLLGKGIEAGMEATGLADKERMRLAREAMKANPELGRGVESPEQATGKAKDIAAAAKEARSVDYEKGFASKEEAEEFAKKMKDPNFRKAQETRMRAGYEKKMKEIEDSSVALPGYILDPGSKNILDKAGSWMSENLPSWLTGTEEEKTSARGMPYEKK